MMDDFDNDILENISDKLTDITELLEKLVEEQYRAKLEFDNVREEIKFKNEFVCCDLDDVDKNLLANNTLLFLGFSRKAVRNLVYNFTESIGANVRYATSIKNIGEFASLVNSCMENDYVLIDCSDMTPSVELLNGITEAIEEDTLSIKIGKGSSTRFLILDIPKIHYILFDTTYFNISKQLRNVIDCCIWNEDERNKRRV